MNDMPWSPPRRLVPADAAALSALEARCFPSGWTREQYERALGDNPAFAAYGAYAGGGLAGYVAFYHTADELEILNVAVEPALRGRGLATAILREVLREARERSIKKSCLEVRRGNIPAVRLYSSAGFEQVGVRKRYYSDTGEDALVMVLQWPE